MGWYQRRVHGECGLVTKSGNMRASLVVLGVLAATNICSSHKINDSRGGKAFSLFSIVQFPNQQCTASSSTTTYGTCFTSSECTSKGGSSDGNCAAGFGVCCVITASTCSSSISTNTTYIRNPNYPSSYTATSAGTCTYTINKVSDDVCQLRLDFQTFSGFVTGGDAGECYDTFAAAGQTGKNPPSNICGTNTGYHMYVEFGASSTDSVSITNTYVSNGLTTAKTYNILARQISCTAEWKAPTDCVQYFTGKSGSVKSYNFQGSQFLKGQIYNNCIRTEKGYCAIQWKESSTTSPDPFAIGADPTALINSDGCDPSANGAFIIIPNLSEDGIQKLPIPPSTTLAFQSQVCGSNFGVEGMKTIAQPLVTRQQPFVLGVYSSNSAPVDFPAQTGFNLDYTQLPCS